MNMNSDHPVDAIKPSKLFLCVSILLAAACCGCGKYDTRPVQGRVTLSDGTPLDAVRLTFERTGQEPSISAMGVTDENGRYSLGTLKANDGAPAGKYRVMVTEPPRNPVDVRPPRIHSKYRNFETSGLQFTVTSQDNTFDLRLDPYERSR